MKSLGVEITEEDVKTVKELLRHLKMGKIRIEL